MIFYLLVAIVLNRVTMINRAVHMAFRPLKQDYKRAKAAIQDNVLILWDGYVGGNFAMSFLHWSVTEFAAHQIREEMERYIISHMHVMDEDKHDAHDAANNGLTSDKMVKEFISLTRKYGGIEMRVAECKELDRELHKLLLSAGLQ